MFVDGPNGTGNNDWGNFDFDPVYCPSPEQFIANLSAYGFGFQVWVANRAFLNTQLFNASEANEWLFPGIDPVQFLRPALNLSIPPAYNYFKEMLSYLPSIGVKGYKVDRGTPSTVPILELGFGMETANLQHSLLPYIQSYTYQATQNGLPINRALFLERPGDQRAYGITDEYFSGEQFLVAHIVNERGSRKVYFPGNRNTKYLEYFNKSSLYMGGSTIAVSLSMSSVLAYVVTGAIIPHGDILQANNKWHENWRPSLVVEVYTSFNVPKTSFVYYNGGDDKEVKIIMSSDKKKKSVETIWGAVGVNGTVIVHNKMGQRNGPFNASGGKEQFHGVQSLFDE